jgi:hypothetical protein
MNRIDTATPNPAGAKAEKTSPESAGARKDGGAAKDAFRALLRRLSTGEPAPARGTTAEAPPAKSGRTAATTPRADAMKTMTAEADAPDPQADPTATPDPTGVTAPAPAEPAAPPAITWPDFLTSPASAPAAANDPEPSAAARPRLDALLRAVSGSLPDAKTGPALPTSSVDIGIGRPDQADATAATPVAPGPTTRDATALLHAALRRDAADGETAPPERDAALPKMSVLTRETHFEPVQRLSPTQQVVTNVLDEIGPADVAETRPAPTASADQPQTSSRGPLRVLHIKLEPEDLGAVVLRMRLVGQSLELHVEAARAETAHLLDKDRDALVRGLRSSGYSPDVVTVQTATVADSAPSQGARSGGGEASGNSAAFQQPSRDGRPGDGRPPVPHSPPRPERAHDDVDPGRAGGDLYV